MRHALTDAADAALPIHVVEADELPQWLAAAPPAHAAWVRANGFSAGLGEVLTLPGADGGLEGALLGWGSAEARARGRHWFAHAASLPEGDWRIEGLDPEEARLAALAWGLAAYRFDRYAVQKPHLGRLVAPQGALTDLTALLDGAALSADLINTPAEDMGPDALEQAIRDLGARHGAEVTSVVGADLLSQGFPLIHTVGRAAARAPRLVELVAGPEDAPEVTLVGKGVCFDTGGLNLKPGGSMALMKKDMGGAATAIGLAETVLALKLPVRLRLLVPAVENAVAGDSFRPGDIFTSRKGLTVEVNNTDAEGRLVLADALAYACEPPAAPALLVSLATLTGAARVALGPDLPALFTDDDGLAARLAEGGRAEADPLWRLPFWDPYEAMIEPGIADLDNAPKGGFAGAITAALFLRRFVPAGVSYAHLDLFGWTPSAQPGRPKGGTAQGARALLSAIRALT